jgi:hypothetical protein
MRSPAAAYYHWPPLWVGATPAWATYPPNEAEADIDIGGLRDEVYRSILSSGIRVRVLREGIFIFDFSSWEPGCPLPSEPFPGFETLASVALRRAAFMNAHLACLYTAIARLQTQASIPMVVTPSDLIGLNSFEDSSPSLNPGGTSDFSLLAALYVLARFPSTYSPDILSSSSLRRLRFRVYAVEIETLKESFRLLDTIIARRDSEHLLDMVDLYLRGWRAYQDHNYSLCLMTMWTITEQLIQELWKRYIGDNRERDLGGDVVNFITGSRQKILTDSRSFTASVISEILSFTGRIPFELYQELTKARKARNDWVHDLNPVSHEAASGAAKVAEQMLRLVEDIDLEVPPQLHLHG